VIRRASAPFLAGVLVAASMPPWGWWPLAFLGIAMYGSIASARRNSAPFTTATAFAVGWFLPAMAWMWFLTAPGYLIAVVLFACLHGLAARGAAMFPDYQHGAALIVFHSLAEVVRLSWPFGGVPLATLAIGQSQSPLAALSPLGGVIAITVVVFWLSLSRKKFRAVLVTFVLIGVANTWDSTRDTGRTIRIAVVQGGGEQGTHAVDSDPREVFNRHLKLTKMLAPDTARDFVLWPENVINVSATGLFAESKEYTEILEEARRLKIPMVVGITEDAGIDSFTNAHIVVQPDGFVSSRYDKVRRVPFGEYMPMRSFLSAIGAPTHLVPRDARPGDGRAWLDIGDERVSVVISWEVFFGGRVNEGITDGGGAILNPTNGSSYTWSILQTQQLASSRLRAREQGRWLVQAAPTGFSAFVDPNGSVHDRTDISAPGVIERTIAVREGRTLYSRLGNRVYIFALLGWALWLFQRRSRAFPRGAS
jgi:apolipoprotein N-acyltransferase